MSACSSSSSIDKQVSHQKCAAENHGLKQFEFSIVPTEANVNTRDSKLFHNHHLIRKEGLIGFQCLRCKTRFRSGGTAIGGEFKRGGKDISHGGGDIFRFDTTRTNRIDPHLFILEILTQFFQMMTQYRAGTGIQIQFAGFYIGHEGDHGLNFGGQKDILIFQQGSNSQLGGQFDIFLHQGIAHHLRFQFLQATGVGDFTKQFRI
mmetsp:Transcript_17032/g.35207  ORF Transcript_17032/g.35207 Transcript_17032/m.35207 type:complete len:205 (-) Transcript_17032:427-1041(-)